MAEVKKKSLDLLNLLDVFKNWNIVKINKPNSEFMNIYFTRLMFWSATSEDIYHYILDWHTQVVE